MSSVEATVRCYQCGRRESATAASCTRCSASFQAMCACTEPLSVFDERCAACGAPHVPKRLPTSRRRSVRAVKWGALAAATGAAAWLALAPRPPAHWKMKAQGIEAYAKDDFQDAAAKFRAVTEQSPGDPEGWYLLAKTYRRLGFPPDAYRALAEKATLVAPDHFPARDFLARTELALGRPDRALEHAQAAVHSNAASGAAWRLLAEVELAGPRPDLPHVQQALERARAGGADTPEVRVMLAEVAIRLNGAVAGRTERLGPAFASLLRAATSALESSDAAGGDPVAGAILRARLHLAAGDAAAARADADAGIAKLTPDAPPDAAARLKVLRAMALFAQGADTRAQAMSEFAAVLRAHPDSSIAASAASFLTASDEGDLARALLSDAAEANDPRGDLHAVLAHVLLEQRDVDGAARAIGPARSASPQNAFFAEIDGAVRAAQRRFGDARAAFSDAARAAPNLASPQVRLAMLAVAEAEGGPAADAALTQGIAELRRLRATFGDDAFLLQALGRLLLATGDVAAAREVLERAAEESPADAAVWVLVAEARRRSGGERALEDAAAAYDRARALRPDDARTVVAGAGARLTAGDASGAADVCTEFLRAHPDEPSALRLRAIAFRHMQMWSAAAEDCRRVRALPGTTDADVFALVDSLYRAGDAVGARAAAAAARPSMPASSAEELDFLAAVHSGDADAAISELRRRGPNPLLASIQFAAGRMDGAVETLRGLWSAHAGDPSTARLLVAALLEADRPTKERIAEARGVLAALAKPSPPGAREFVEGRILLAEEDVPGAVARLRTAQRESPTDPLASLYLGEALFRAGDRDESLAALRRAAALPGAPPAVPHIVAVHLFRASLDARDVDRAEALAVEALRFDALLVDSAFRAIALRHARGRFAEAAELAQAELGVVGLPDEATARLRLACAYDRLCAGEFQVAETIVESLPPSVRDSTTGRLLAAFADLGASRLDDADRGFAAVVAREPDNAAATTGRVFIDVRRGDRAAAVARVGAWRAAHPDDRDVTLAAVLLLARTGGADDAVRLAEACAEKRPGELIVAVTRADALRRAGRRADAVAVVRRWASAAPKEEATRASLVAADVAVKCRIDLEPALAAARSVAADPAAAASSRRLAETIAAEALSELGRRDEASAAARAVVEKIGASADRTTATRLLESRARFVVGFSAASASPPQRASAIEEFGKCLELAPGNADAANDLAWLLAQDAATARRALDLARAVTAGSPDEASYWDTRAEAARRAGEFDETRSSWDKALRLAAAAPGGDGSRAAGFAVRYGRFLRERGEDAAAKEVVERALAAVKGGAAEAELRRFLAE